MKTNKQKIGHFFLYQKDMHIIYLIKRSNQRQKLNKSGVKVVYPKILLQDTRQSGDSDAMKSLVISKVEKERSRSLPALVDSSPSKCITSSVPKANKPSCSVRHEKRAIEYRNNKMNLHLHRKEFNSFRRFEGRIRDKPELGLQQEAEEKAELRQQFEVDQWFERKLQRKREMENNRREINRLIDEKGAHTERRKINIIGLKNECIINEMPKIISEKTIDIEDKQTPSHRLYKSLVKSKEQGLTPLCDYTNSEIKDESSMRKRDTSFFLRKMSQKAVEKSVQTINSFELPKKR